MDFRRERLRKRNSLWMSMAQVLRMSGQFSLKVMPLKNHIAIECSRQLCYALLRKTNVRVEECFNICNRSQFATTSSI